jgi:lysophospholipase L1-like esterase
VRRPRLFRLGAVSLGVLAALLVLELGLRVLGYSGAADRSQRVFDPRYGQVQKDSWIFDFQIDPTRHHAVELRGQHIPLDKPAGELRVLFIGDSGTAGAFLPIEQSFPLRFQQLLRQRDPDTRVRAINAGVWGMTTIDEYHLLRDKLLPLQPDVVVVGLFMANDINFNLGHRQRRLRQRAPRLLDGLRRRSALGHLLFLQALALNQRFRLFDADDLGSSWVPVELSLVDERGMSMLSYPAGEVALYMREPSALVDEAFAVLRDVLAQLQGLGRSAGFELRVLLIPTPSAVTGRLNVLHHPNILHELRGAGVRVQSADLDFGLPTRRVLSICRELELPCVDPTRRLAKLGLAAFFEGDEHPSATAHGLLAEALLSQ